jgi:hypothetical protein
LGSYLTKVHFDIFVINYSSGYFNIGYSAIVSRNPFSTDVADGIKALVMGSLPVRIANS